MLKKISIQLITSYTNYVPILSWVDITDYVEQGLSINDSCDGTYDSGRLVFTIDESIKLGNLSAGEPLPPRLPIKYEEYQTATDTKPSVSYIFETSDVACDPIRTKQSDDKGVVSAIYTYEVPYVEKTKDLDSKFPPNTSVRQPKNIYNRIYQRSTGWKFALNDASVKYADGTDLAIDSTSYVNDSPDLNNEQGIISVNNASSAIIKLSSVGGNGINNEDYSLAFEFNVNASAPQLVNCKAFGLIDDTRFIYPYFAWINSTSGISIKMVSLYNVLPFKLEVTAEYYDASNTLVKTSITSVDVAYSGDSIIRDQTDENFVNIPSSTNVGYQVGKVIVKRLSNASYVLVKPKIKCAELRMLEDDTGPGYGKLANDNLTWSDALKYTNIVKNTFGGDNEYKVAYYPKSLSVSITSSAIQETVLDSYKTLYDVALKALNEINLKERTKFSFSERLSVLLQTKQAPEMTLENYSLKELMTKLCRIVEVLPVLGDTDILNADEDPLTTISYVKPGENYTSFDVDKCQFVDNEKSNTLAEYYDVISSRQVNTIADNNHHTESVMLQATSLDYTQLTQDNAGFVVSYPIYWLKQIKIKGLGIPYTTTSGSGTAYGNDHNFAPGDEENQSWDMTDRCFEEDIYKALPDVNYITETGRKQGKLSQANTISYKSGELYIKNIGHTGPAIPDYEPGITSNLTIVPNLAIVECAVVLAYNAYASLTAYAGFNVVDTLTLTISDLYNLVADIDFVALNDFTYRNVSLDKRKYGHNIETRVNSQDKVTSYADSTRYIKAEQNKQGNIVVSPTLIYPNVMSCLKTGVRVNNGYILTTRKLKIFREYVECSYEFTKNYVIQSDDIKLDIMFERYSIPYDFVRREVLSFNHIILGYNKYQLESEYGNDNGKLDQDFAGDSVLIVSYLDKDYKTISNKISTSVAQGQIIDLDSYKTKIGGYVFSQLLITDASHTDYDITDLTIWTIAGITTTLAYIYTVGIYKLTGRAVTSYSGTKFNTNVFVYYTPVATTLTYPLHMILDTDPSFANPVSFTIDSASDTTKTLKYTEATLLSGKGSGIIYIKDTDNNISFTIDNVITQYLAPTIEASYADTKHTRISFSISGMNDYGNIWYSTKIGSGEWSEYINSGTSGHNLFVKAVQNPSTTEAQTIYCRAVNKYDDLISQETTASLLAEATLANTLDAIVINSATMLNASGDLEVNYTNPNSITVQGDFDIAYAIGDTGGGLDYSNGISLTSGTHTFTTNTVNAKGSINCAKCYADGYNDSVSSNVVSYNAYATPPTSYSLTLHYFKDGVEDVSLRETKSIAKGTEVFFVDYIKELPGYTYQDNVPHDSFIMVENYSIQYNYITTPPSSYSLTLHYFKDGSEDVSLRETKSIEKGTEVFPSDYKKELTGFTYQDSVPNDSFTMNDNNSISYHYINSSPKGSKDNPLTANDLNNNYIYWDYESSSFCVKNVNSGNVIYNLIDGSFSEDSDVYVKSGFDFILKFKTRSGSDVRNYLLGSSTDDIATISPAFSSGTDLNQGQLYSYTIHGLSKGCAFNFNSDDDGMDFGRIYIYIV